MPNRVTGAGSAQRSQRARTGQAGLNLPWGSASLRFFYPDVELLPLPAGHRFPAGKYALLRAAVEGEEVLPRAALMPSPPAGTADLLRAHGADYVSTMLDGTVAKDIIRRIG